MTWFAYTSLNPLPLLSTEASDDIAVYFRGLGYDISMDFNTRKGERWYEISDGDGMFCQIDFGAELRHLVTDMTYWATNDDPVGISDGPDYKISNKLGCPRFKRLCEAVAKKGMPV